jgi:hypothetical protein
MRRRCCGTPRDHSIGRTRSVDPGRVCQRFTPSRPPHRTWVGWEQNLEMSFSLRPGDRWEMSFDPLWSRGTDTRQFVTTEGNSRAETFGTRYVFAHVDLSEISVNRRLPQHTFLGEALALSDPQAASPATSAWMAAARASCSASGSSANGSKGSLEKPGHIWSLRGRKVGTTKSDPCSPEFVTRCTSAVRDPRSTNRVAERDLPTGDQVAAWQGLRRCDQPRSGSDADEHSIG